MSDLSPHFSSTEFECRCGCGLHGVSPRLVEILERARVISGVPFPINSGRRCAVHNISVGGKPQSAHLTGQAADIATLSNRDRYLILMGLIGAGARRLEIRPQWIHVDVADDDAHPQDVCWL